VYPLSISNDTVIYHFNNSNLGPQSRFNNNYKEGW